MPICHTYVHSCRTNVMPLSKKGQNFLRICCDSCDFSLTKQRTEHSA